VGGFEESAVEEDIYIKNKGAKIIVVGEGPSFEDIGKVFPANHKLGKKKKEEKDAHKSKREVRVT